MPSRTLWVVSLSGLIPFLVCLAIAAWVPPLREAAVSTFLLYAALTLTFLGGARWGAELVRAPDAPRVGRLIASAIPSTVALLALLPQTPRVATFTLLTLSSAGQLVWDIRASQQGILPSWNARLRTVMTALGTACLLLIWRYL
ncbi:MAG: hypothetical protein RLZZ621_2638 [Gemmatimonadota bacterium]|jgi:hypothetical protein